MAGRVFNVESRGAVVSVLTHAVGNRIIDYDFFLIETPFKSEVDTGTRIPLSWTLPG